MVLSVANRLYIRRLLRGRVVKIVLALLVIINFLDVLHIHQKVANSDVIRRQPHARQGERVYIASMHFNDAVLLDSHWNREVLRLVDTLGPQNVFFSSYESGSWDETKELLHWLDRELGSKGVPRHIVISDRTHEDEINAVGEGEGGGHREGWIETPQGTTAVRRIPFLARLRNKTLQDLLELSEQGIKFDKVLFLNDVVFTVSRMLLA
jgi:hypothetical protein